MKKYRLLLMPMVILAGWCVFSSPLYAQERATIVGTVTDSTGAIMPDVKVTVTHTGTMISRSLVTNSAGNSPLALIQSRPKDKASKPTNVLALY